MRDRLASLSKEKPIDTTYIDQLLAKRLDTEMYPSLRIRDEVQIYHRARWRKDFVCFKQKVERIKSEITGEREKKEGEYNDAELRMAKIQKYIPDDESPKIPWDWVSITEAGFTAACLLAIVCINTINIPKLLTSKVSTFFMNPSLATLFVLSISLATIGVKLAEKNSTFSSKENKAEYIEQHITCLHMERWQSAPFLHPHSTSLHHLQKLGLHQQLKMRT